jgi:ubiquinone/menaquinone biosynthesis C-methylase UbiE
VVVTYDLNAYGAMIADRVRMDAYEEALRRVVTPTSVVLDIGAGPGILSLLAARLGARRVIAVDPNPLIRVGARLAAENGFSDRICFIHGRSEQIELTEKADVVVGDLRGMLPNSQVNIAAIVDARRRLMKPEGTLIPLRDTVFAAPVEAREAYSKIVAPWTDGRFGLSMRGGAESILNEGVIKLESVDRLLGTGQPVARLEYRSVETPNIDANVEMVINEAGTVHGLSLWFDAELVPGVGFSTAPNLEKTVYGRVFLPLPGAIEVEPGEVICARIRANLDENTMIWVWNGSLRSRDGSSKATFSSSSAFSNPETPAVREVIGETCAPALTEDGQMVRELLSRIDGIQSVAVLAAGALARHPESFEYDEDAVILVRKVIERYGEVILRVED